MDLRYGMAIRDMYLAVKRSCFHFALLKDLVYLEDEQFYTTTAAAV